MPFLAVLKHFARKLLRALPFRPFLLASAEHFRDAADLGAFAFFAVLGFLPDLAFLTAKAFLEGLAFFEAFVFFTALAFLAAIALLEGFAFLAAFATGAGFAAAGALVAGACAKLAPAESNDIIAAAVNAFNKFIFVHSLLEMELSRTFNSSSVTGKQTPLKIIHGETE